MIRKLLSAGAFAALMLAPASPAASSGGSTVAQAMPERVADTDDSDLVPAPMALLLALAAAGLIWGRRLNASARKARESADSE